MKVADPKGRVRKIHSSVDARGRQHAWVRSGIVRREHQYQYGKRVEENLARRLAAKGWTVVEP